METDLVRICIQGLDWGEIQEIANEGLDQSSHRYNDPKACHDLYTAHEPAIWDYAAEMATDLGEHQDARCPTLALVAGFNNAGNISSLRELAVALGQFAVEEACRAVNDDFDNYGDTESTEDDEYAQFRDVWGRPLPEKEDAWKPTDEALIARVNARLRSGE